MLRFPFGYDPRMKIYMPFYLMGAEMSIIHDYSMNGNDGAVTGAIPDVDGSENVQRSWYLDGSDDKIVISHDASLNIDHQTDFTFATWLKIPTTQPEAAPADTRNELITKKDASSYPFHIEMYNQESADDGKLRFRRYDGTNAPTVVATTTVNDGVWHCIVFKKASDNMYINIVDLDSSDGPIADSTTSDPSNSEDLGIGHNIKGGDNFFELNIGLLCLINGYGFSTEDDKNFYEQTRHIFGR